jgi:hypothetical protein
MAVSDCLLTLSFWSFTLTHNDLPQSLSHSHSPEPPCIPPSTSATAVVQAKVRKSPFLPTLPCAPQREDDGPNHTGQKSPQKGRRLLLHELTSSHTHVLYCHGDGDVLLAWPASQPVWFDQGGQVPNPFKRTRNSSKAHRGSCLIW